MICNKCGRENSNESKICMYCGNNLHDTVSKGKLFDFKSKIKKRDKQVVYGSNKRNSISIKIIAGCTIIVLFVFVSLYVFKNYVVTEKVDFEELYLSNSFFLQDMKDSKKYYLYDDKGQKILDEVFYSAGKFYDNASIVYDDAKKVGLISDTGEMLINFGKYLKIERRGFLYKVTDKDNRRFLVDKNNKKIADLKDVSILSMNSNYFSILDNKSTYKVIDYKGKKIAEIKKTGTSVPKVSVKSGYLSLFYNSVNYLFDLTTSKKVLEFSDSNHYCVNSVNNDNSEEVILNLCGDSKEKHEYKYINKSKILKTIIDECDKLSFSNGNLICQSSDNKQNYVYSRDLYKSFLTTDKSINYNSDASYIKAEDNEVHFYKDNKIVEKVSCYTLASTGRNSGLYRLKTIKANGCSETSNMYQFYNENGKKVNNTLYKYASDFDKNGNSIVGLDSSTYFLINDSGKKISEEYSYLTFIKTSQIIYYLAANKDSSYVLNKDGKVVYTLSKNETVQVERVRDSDYLIIKSKDLYSIYDITNRLMLVEKIPSYVLTNNYITTLDYDYYFSYRGTLIDKK